MVTMNIAAIKALLVIVQLTSILKIKDIGMIVEMNQKFELFLLENDLAQKNQLPLLSRLFLTTGGAFLVSLPLSTDSTIAMRSMTMEARSAVCIPLIYSRDN